MSGQTGVPLLRLGTIESSESVIVTEGEAIVLDVTIADAKSAWQGPLDW
jgi:phosphoribosylformylglycinamidine synthase